MRGQKRRCGPAGPGRGTILAVMEGRILEKGKIGFQSSVEQLNQGFAWAKRQALFYAHDDDGGAGSWYEAALPGRNAFCMRDVSHQAEGAAALGLSAHTKNMLYLFAKSISEKRDYCGYWEITGEGLPCPDDYENDADFWYNLPGSFEVIVACWQQYLWTGDEDYLKDPVFLNFYRQTCEEFVKRWDVDGDGILEHYPEQGRRGIATYNEADISIKAGADMLAAQYAAYGCMERICRVNGEREEAERYLEKQRRLKERYLTGWRCGDGKGFHGALLLDGTFMQGYDDEGNFLPIRFGILDGEGAMKEAIAQVAEHEPANVEGRSYYPQIFYRCGEREKGLRYLLSLCDPALYRREYPEVSYALIGTVANWLMGVSCNENGEIVTCSALPENEWAKLEYLPVLHGEVSVTHRGKTETEFENLSQRTVRWKASFLGRYETAFCGNEAYACGHEKNAAGEDVSWVILDVAPGTALNVRVSTEKPGKRILQIDIPAEGACREGGAAALLAEEADCSAVSLKMENCGEKLAATVSFSWPLLDICGIWYPNCGKERSLQADWTSPNRSMTCISAPVVCLFDEEGTNRLTFALAEAAKEVFFAANVREEDGTLSCYMRLLLDQEELPYRTQLYLNWEGCSYADALGEVAAWWEEDCGMEAMQVPEAARLPMYSAWYSYHQNISAEELEKEAALAKQAGFETLIVDDGWQTEDGNRGYAYCGDWQVAGKKIPDMKAHVKRVHELGMKYMIWFSVPFVGISSKAWKRFSDKLLWYDGGRCAGVLDIRYPEVREYLLGFYRHAVGEWDLDGLKLDFVDEFYIRKEKPVLWKEGMDFKRVEAALGFFLKQVRQELQRIKPEVMIEFRQWYVGPHMRSFGNIIRVTDCPESAMNNRVGSVDIRLLCRNTAVHSDMIMWHRAERAENAARQIINSLFANLQLSVKLEEQDEEKLKMIRFWTRFIREKKDVLQEGRLMPAEPQNLYPVITAAKGEEAVTAVYSANRRIFLQKEYSRHTLINGVKQNTLILDVEKEGGYHIRCKDCMGNVLYEEDKWLERGLVEMPVTPSGLIEIVRN